MADNPSAIFCTNRLPCIPARVIPSVRERLHLRGGVIFLMLTDASVADEYGSPMLRDPVAFD